ncbi:MAG: ferritin family protein [Planctomycetota bacterium]|nr:MAG: ferritin family protein [Planctomycetota bacterium]
MEKEKYSENYYRQLAAQADNTALRNIFTMLADEEAKHYKTVSYMKKNVKPNLAQISVLPDAKEIFAEMRGSPDKFDFNISHLELYNKAKDIEAQAKKFYLEKEQQVEIDAQKDIFLKLADEEQKHFILLQNIIDFVSRPQTWLENAEWHHLNEY